MQILRGGGGRGILDGEEVSSLSILMFLIKPQTVPALHFTCLRTQIRAFVFVYVYTQGTRVVSRSKASCNKGKGRGRYIDLDSRLFVHLYIFELYIDFRRKFNSSVKILDTEN